MLIGGVHKLTLIDFPGKIAATVFTVGCNFRCPYCHNKDLVLAKQSLSEQVFFDFLKNKQKKLDGIVISGGEPTIHKDLISFIQKIKSLGFLTKLDTSGSNPSILKELLDKKLLDYIAMDIKAPLHKYASVINAKVNISNIQQSISLILNSSIDFEFRTTLVKELHSKEDILDIAKLLNKNSTLYLQMFISKNPLDPSFINKNSFSKNELLQLKPTIEKYVKKCCIR